MKSIKYFATLLLMFAFTASLSAQDLPKDVKKALEKEVKAMTKEGWKVKPGTPSLFDQSARARRVQLEEDDEGNPKWQIGAASSVGTIYDAARIQANNLAKTELANAISSRLTAKFASEGFNKQTGNETAESMAETAMKSQNVTVDQHLANPRILFEAYKDLPNGNIEVSIRIALQTKKIDDAANSVYESYKKANESEEE